MGFISSSTSFTRYQIKDHLPADYRRRYTEEIRRYAFREIDEHSDDERSSGWVNIMNMLDSEFPGEEFFIGEFIALSLRIDTRRVPSHVLRTYCLKAEQERKAALGKDFLSKNDRQDIRDMVRSQLLKRAIPNSRTFDMIWDVKSNQVLFSSTNGSICLEFQELFKKTFDQNMVQLFPYILAQSMLTDDEKVTLEDIPAVNFVSAA
ncbi:MAG: recombination-associated protein RdgC [bacterium]